MNSAARLQRADHGGTRTSPGRCPGLSTGSPSGCVSSSRKGRLVGRDARKQSRRPIPLGRPPRRTACGVATPWSRRNVRHELCGAPSARGSWGDAHIPGALPRAIDRQPFRLRFLLPRRTARGAATPENRKVGGRSQSADFRCGGRCGSPRRRGAPTFDGRGGENRVGGRYRSADPRGGRLVEPLRPRRSLRLAQILSECGEVQRPEQPESEGDQEVRRG